MNFLLVCKTVNEIKTGYVICLHLTLTDSQTFQNQPSSKTCRVGLLYPNACNVSLKMAVKENMRQLKQVE